MARLRPRTIGKSLERSAVASNWGSSGAECLEVCRCDKAKPLHCCWQLHVGVRLEGVAPGPGDGLYAPARPPLPQLPIEDPGLVGLVDYDLVRLAPPELQGHTRAGDGREPVRRTAEDVSAWIGAGA
jgi:hypothetical protein